MDNSVREDGSYRVLTCLQYEEDERIQIERESETDEVRNPGALELKACHAVLLLGIQRKSFNELEVYPSLWPRLHSTDAPACRHNLCYSGRLKRYVILPLESSDVISPAYHTSPFIVFPEDRRPRQSRAKGLFRQRTNIPIMAAFRSSPRGSRCGVVEFR